MPEPVGGQLLEDEQQFVHVVVIGIAGAGTVGEFGAQLPPKLGDVGQTGG